MNISITESAVASEKRIQHLEDLILWGGSKGFLDAIKSLKSSIKNSSGKMTVKWDGSPAVVFGRNDIGQFIFTDKHGFSAKSYDGKSKSKEDLKKMLLSRGKGEKSEAFIKFSEDMARAFELFEKSIDVNFRGYLVGDMMYFKKPLLVDGNIVIKPNVVKYVIDPSTDLGKTILSSEVGVVVHKVVGLDGVSPINISPHDVVKSDGVCVIPTIKTSDASGVDISKLIELSKQLAGSFADIDSLLNYSDLKAKKPNMMDMMPRPPR